MGFDIVGEITGLDRIASGRGIREYDRLVQTYGPGRWRKMKGAATVRLPDGKTVRAELHWYEARGIGRKEFKIKRSLKDAS